MCSVGIYSSSSALLLTWGVHKAEIIIISKERLICRSHPAAEMVPLVEDVPHTLVVLLPLGLMHNDLTKRRFQSRSTQQLLPNRLNGWSNVHALCTANPVPYARKSFPQRCDGTIGTTWHDDERAGRLRVWLFCFHFSLHMLLLHKLSKLKGNTFAQLVLV